MIIEIQNQFRQIQTCINISQIKEILKLLKSQNSFSSFAIQDALATFYKKLDEVMTVEDYAILANRKTEAKAELSLP
jgi:hypothetical protein